MTNSSANESGSHHRSTDRSKLICDTFQRQCRDQRMPRIEEFVVQVDERDRPLLLEQLLSIEIQTAVDAGRKPPSQRQDYLARFPQYASVVSKVLDELAATLRAQQTGKDATRPVKKASEETSSLLDTQLMIDSPTCNIHVSAQFSHYEIKRKLGEGAMGAVFLAEDPRLERNVALKVPFISDRHQKAVLDRFREEARAVAAIRHPNICPVYEVGEHDGIPFIVMAYIEGHRLTEIVHEDELPEIEYVADLIIRIARALAKVHYQGVIHRDLKPSNIMIDEQGEPVIMDFGLARRKKTGSGQLSTAGTAIGTPAYMSPEQLRGRTPVGPVCDVYALGVIFYELLTGRRPYSGDVFEIISQMVLSTPEPPSVHRPEISPELDKICLKAMAPEFADRYQSMDELASALTDYLVQIGAKSLLSGEDRITADDLPEQANRETLSDVGDISKFLALQVAPGEIGIRLLDVSDSDDKSEWVFAVDDEITIGRDEGNSVQVFNQRVSRRHAVIRYDEEQWKYANQGRNGTFVDGERCDDFDVQDCLVVRLSKSGPRLQFSLRRQGS